MRMLLVNLLIILSISVSWTLGVLIVPCVGNAYMDCRQYCGLNCPDRGSDCIYHCNNGCGCSSSIVVRNNGGCHLLSQCTFEDKTDEEENPGPNVNGEKPLNLMDSPYEI